MRFFLFIFFFARPATGRSLPFVIKLYFSKWILSVLNHTQSKVTSAFCVTPPSQHANRHNESEAVSHLLNLTLGVFSMPASNTSLILFLISSPSPILCFFLYRNSIESVLAPLFSPSSHFRIPLPQLVLPLLITKSHTVHKARLRFSTHPSHCIYSTPRSISHHLLASYPNNNQSLFYRSS